MKIRFIYALVIVGAMTAFSSCDDSDVPGSSLEEKTYSGTEVLSLNLNGTPLVGKTVTFIPGTDGKATVTLSGEPLDISQIMGMIQHTEHQGVPTVPTAGVLPGSPSVSIPVELQGDADNCTFEGTGETEYCTYSYSGSAAADTFEFNLTDVKLKNTSLAGTWTLPDFLDDPDDEYSGNFFNVARVEWDAEKEALIELFPGYETGMPIESIIRMALVLPMFEPDEDGNATASPLQMLENVLYSITLGEDGDVTAEYLDVKTGEIKTASTGLAQYVVTTDGALRLFLNPAAIIANTVANTKSSTRAADIAIVVEDLMRTFIPMLTEGIPVYYGPAIADDEGKIAEEAISFYLGTETLKPILSAVAPLMADEDFVNSIVEKASQDPSMGSMAGMLPGILRFFPGIVETTSKVEIGINLKRK